MRWFVLPFVALTLVTTLLLAWHNRERLERQEPREGG